MKEVNQFKVFHFSQLFPFPSPGGLCETSVSKNMQNNCSQSFSFVQFYLLLLLSNETFPASTVRDVVIVGPVNAGVQQDTKQPVDVDSAAQMDATQGELLMACKTTLNCITSV